VDMSFAILECQDGNDVTSISPEWLRICFFLKVGQTLVAIELDGGQMVPLTTETPFAP
jgi:hypothetical protein